MHVAHLYDGHERVHEGRGSVPGVVWNVARLTADAGHDVTVLERQWRGLDPLAEHEGVRFRRLSLRTGAEEPWERVPYDLVDSPAGLLRLVGDRTNFAAAAYRHLRDLDPDVVHVHLPFAANVLATVAPWLRSRMVYTAHLGDLRMNSLEGDDVDVPSVLRFASPDAFLAKRAARTTVLNPAIRDGFLDHGVPPDRLDVVPNGVDVDRFADPDPGVVERVRDRYDLGGPKQSGATVLFVGTVMPRKGVRELVEAFASARSAVPEGPIDLVVAGEHDLDPAYTDTVYDAIGEADLADRVRLAGFVDEEALPALYALADVLAVPSLEEGFGMTAIEGMAAGTPVVATRVGGLPEVVDDGVHGRLVDPGDVDGLASALAELLGDDDGRARMGEAAVDRAASYSWSGVTKHFLSLYEEVYRSD